MGTENSDLSKYRRNYSKSSLRRKDLLYNPIDQFKLWFDDALKMNNSDANAFALSTVNPQGHPSSRIVLLKEIEEEGFVFYTNYNSDKAKDIHKNTHVAMLFFWKNLERQVRISGIALKFDEVRAKEYFQSRPKESQIGAWASKQSQSLENREELEHSYNELHQRYLHSKSLPKPPYWGGFIIKPEYFEFWQGRADRLHDRFRYSQEQANQWNIVRLSP